MSGFQHQNPLPASTDYLLSRLHGGAGRRRKETAGSGTSQTESCSKREAGRLLGTLWRICHSASKQRCHQHLVLNILKPDHLSFRNLKYGCMKAEIWVYEKLRDLPVLEETDSRVVPIIKIPDLVLSFSIPLLNNEKKKKGNPTKLEKEFWFGSSHRT